MALPIVLSESEILTLRKIYKEWLTSVGMKFFKRTTGYTIFGHKRNEEILEELKIEEVDKKLRR